MRGTCRREWGQRGPPLTPRIETTKLPTYLVLTSRLVESDLAIRDSEANRR
jgi:hypothetical protein